jgi:hypothetical protein
MREGEAMKRDGRGEKALAEGRADKPAFETCSRPRIALGQAQPSGHQPDASASSA